MVEKEYIVSLKRDVDYDSFWNQMETLSAVDSFVPSRRIDIVNNRDVSIRQCHYALTDSEAEMLRNDPRVYAVEEKTKFKPMHRAKQSGNFNKTTSSSGNFINWGLRRCIETTNVYGTSSTITGDYTYSLDGTGVDVVIQDSGLQVDHPEFRDANGVSRVQQINWYTASGVSGTQSINHYRDTDGHGTHVAGIVAGKTYGWAKNARIYSVKVDGLDGGEGGGITDPACFDVIIGWHNNKPIDPATGFKRPTIVNMSWGYSDYFYNINGGVYRGTAWTGTSRRTDYGMIGVSNGVYYAHGARISYIDVSIQEMIDAGIHICIAAGNNYMKIDLPAGNDYNNYYNGGYYNGSGPNYYHRGSSPYDNEAFIVGSVDSTVNSATLDQKSNFSESGPAVDLYAPGSNIMSSTSTTNAMDGAAYYANALFKQVNISGTSMASPQVCGLGALILQMYPGATPAQLKNYMLSNCTTDVLYTTGLDNDYTSNRSVKGGNTRILYKKVGNTDTSVSTSGAITLQNINLGH